MSELTQRIKNAIHRIDRSEPPLSTGYLKNEWVAIHGTTSLEKRQREFYRFCMNRIVTPIYDSELIVGSFPYREFRSNAPALPDMITGEEKAQSELDAKSLYASCSKTGDIPDYEKYKEIYYADVNWGHIIVDYEKVLNTGLGGIKSELSSRLEAPIIAKEQLHFLKCASENLAGVQEYIRRYAKEAEAKAQDSTLPRKNELESIGKVCEKIAEQAPETFQEALQLLWFIQMGLEIESGVSAFSYGRIDQYLYPFYRNDLEKAILDKEQIKELLCCFWIKNASCSREISDAGRAITLGGMTAEKTDAVNELTYLILELSEQMRLFQPKLNARVWNGSTREYVKLCCRVCRSNIGPMLYYDEAVIEALTAYGYSWEDAVQYGLIGCYEYSVPGIERSSPMGCRIDVAKCLELAMNNGRSITSGAFLGKQNGMLDEYQSFEGIRKSFEEQFSLIVDKAAATLVYSELSHRLNHPHPFQSALVSDCIASGKDVSNFGARYSTVGVRISGLVDVADSLTAIKELVFEKRELTLERIRNGIQMDFKNDIILSAILRNKAGKYGNDIEEADRTVRELGEFICQTVSAKTHLSGQKLRVGLFSFLDFMVGENGSALPSGHRKGVPFANGISPSHGMDRNGPTAVLNSAAKLNYTLSNNASVLDLKLPANTFTDEKGLALLCDLVMTYFRRGGTQLQLYFLSAEDLRNAQKTPELYPNLAVRVTGYSANFTELPRNIQDEIIMRTASF